MQPRWILFGAVTTWCLASSFPGASGTWLGWSWLSRELGGTEAGAAQPTVRRNFSFLFLILTPITLFMKKLLWPIPLLFRMWAFYFISSFLPPIAWYFSPEPSGTGLVAQLAAGSAWASPRASRPEALQDPAATPCCCGWAACLRCCLPRSSFTI